jgi:5'-nucleotidase
MKKPILYVDMDDVLCDYKGGHAAASAENPYQKYPQAHMDFYRKLKPLDGAIEGLLVLNASDKFDIWILTRPSFKNPLCYTEKRLWVEDHLGIEWCEKLILSPDKGLLKGQYLIDDMEWPEFEGVQFLFDNVNITWSRIVKTLLTEVPKYREIEGDILELSKKQEVIAHGCNCQSKMGAGLAPKMAEKFGCDKFEMELMGPDKSKLGKIDHKKVDGINIVNAYTQEGYGPGKQVDYDAIINCMRAINKRFAGHTVSLPKIGAGLGGGDWDIIKDIIKRELVDCWVTIHYI